MIITPSISHFSSVFWVGLALELGPVQGGTLLPSRDTPGQSWGCFFGTVATQMILTPIIMSVYIILSNPWINIESAYESKLNRTMQFVSMPSLSNVASHVACCVYRAACRWRSWACDHWRFSCAAFWRSRATGKVSDGSRSTSTDFRHHYIRSVLILVLLCDYQQ